MQELKTALQIFICNQSSFTHEKKETFVEYFQPALFLAEMFTMTH